MAGSVLAALTYYWRMKMPETAHYIALVAQNVERAMADMSNVLQVEIQADHEKVELKLLITDVGHSHGCCSCQ